MRWHLLPAHTHCNILSFRYALWFWIAVVSMASPVFLIVFSPFLKTAANGEAAAAAAVDAEVSFGVTPMFVFQFVCAKLSCSIFFARVIFARDVLPYIRMRMVRAACSCCRTATARALSWRERRRRRERRTVEGES